MAEAGLALLNSTSTGSKKNSKKKALAKAKEALAKAQETKSETKKAEEATEVTEDLMKAGFQVDLEKAKQARQGCNDHYCKPDVHVLFKPAFSQEQVRL